MSAAERQTPQPSDNQIDLLGADYAKLFVFSDALNSGKLTTSNMMPRERSSNWLNSARKTEVLFKKKINCLLAPRYRVIFYDHYLITHFYHWVSSIFTRWFILVLLDQATILLWRSSATMALLNFPVFRYSQQYFYFKDPLCALYYSFPIFLSRVVK